MPVEQLTYAQIAERLGVSSEAARAIVKRHRLPRSRANDGKTLIAVDLAEVRHTPLTARSPRGRKPTVDVVAELHAKIATLESDLVTERWRSAGHRADYKHERDRADQLVTTHDRLVSELEQLRALLETATVPVHSQPPAELVSELENLRALMAAAQEAARPVTTRTWRWWQRRAG
jgi:hypothetical protein